MCEDYPCCGHTPEDPCTRQAYDEPGYFDTSLPGNEHALCDHENGECDVDEEEFEDCEECGEPVGQCDRSCSMPAERAYELNGDWMEDQWLDGSYEE